MSDESNPQLSKILEGAILAAGEPLSVVKLQTLFDDEGIPEKDDIEKALLEIKASCETRGYDLVEVASGWRFQVREDLAQWVNRLWEEKPQKYSRALLETMALVAYRQPLTRGDIEEVRGVAVSSHIIKTLTERGWVKVVGHRDVPGRPALYATTKGFLDYFNLKSLDELPSLGELKDIESLNQDLEFGILEPAAASHEHSEDGEDVIATESAFADGDGDSEQVSDGPASSAADTASSDSNGQSDKKLEDLANGIDGKVYENEDGDTGDEAAEGSLDETAEGSSVETAEGSLDKISEGSDSDTVVGADNNTNEVLGDTHASKVDEHDSPSEDTERLND